MRLLTFVVLVIVSTASKGMDNRKHVQNRFLWLIHKTKTTTMSTTLTVTSSTVGLCAKLVNVTGACRRRKGLWIDEPQVLTFDEDIDDAVDAALLPTRRIQIETTSEPNLNSRSTSDRLFGSLMDHEEEKPHGIPLFNKVMNEPEDQTSRNFFRRRTPVMVTSVKTISSTRWITLTTKTFYIQICTPSPFPFNVCLSFRYS